MESRVSRDVNEYEKLLEQQLKKLKDFNKKFDDGHEDYHQEIALVLRKLLHDTKKQKSLLSLLGYKHNIKFHDTAGEFNQENLLTEFNLVFMRLHIDNTRLQMDVTTKFVPNPENKLIRRLNFSEWWEHTVMSDRQKRLFARKDLILEVADTDGGAHFDSALKDFYDDMKRRNSINWVYEYEGKVVPIGNPIPASLRQISNEVMSSIDEYTRAKA